MDIAEHYSINVDGAHRAYMDCWISKACFDALKDDIEVRGLDIYTIKSKSHKGISAKDISTENTEFDREHPLFGKVCAFTGPLEKMQRKEAMRLVADLGGILGDGVTKKTNFLI